MRPVLKPALRRLWRGDAAVQLGADPESGVVLDGITEATSSVLSLLDGSRDRRQVVAAAATSGAHEGDVRRLLDLLRTISVLDDAGAVPKGLSAAERARLEPDLATLTLLTTQPGDGAACLERRRAASVLVIGAGRVGSLVCALLGAAGVGHLAIRDDRMAEPSDAVPGGLLPRDDGQPRAIAAMDAAQRAGAASVDGAVRPPDAEDCAAADLAVVAVDGWLAPPREIVDVLAAVGLPYLVTGVCETYGVVGPLVIPGRTSCPRCHDLRRADRDPSWPVVAAQLSAEVRGATPACDVTLATGVAALAAGQVLAHLMGPGLARAVDATLELRLPEWSVRRRAWTAHPECACGAAARAGRDARAGEGGATAEGRAPAGAGSVQPGAGGVAPGGAGGAAVAGAGAGGATAGAR